MPNMPHEPRCTKKKIPTISAHPTTSSVTLSMVILPMHFPYAHFLVHLVRFISKCNCFAFPN